MAENKEITTLHPYMNRNKNRYPNVKEENIPDTIQRKMTAGAGISISPDNVISATGGDSYTRSETDALLETKADKVALENVNKVVPTDIAVKNGKLGLEHDTTWLTNQKAITLGNHLTYDALTNTLDAEGGGAALPAGTEEDPFRINKSKLYAYTNQELVLKSVNRIDIDGNDSHFYLYYYYGNKITNVTLINETEHNVEYRLDYFGLDNYRKIVNVKNENTIGAVIQNKNNFEITKIPTDKTESYYLDATYDATSGTSAIKWSSLKKTYNHYIVISDGTASNSIYLLIPSTNNLKCNSLTDLNTLLGIAQRFIQASGVVTNNASKLPIVALNWQGSIETSKILTMSSEEAVTKFTHVVDVVEPA